MAISTYSETVRSDKPRSSGFADGFSAVEVLIIIIIMIVLVTIGVFVWQHRHQTHAPLTVRPVATQPSPAPAAKSGSNSVPTAPQVNNSSELNSALQALNQANISANNTDSGSLSSNSSGF